MRTVEAICYLIDKPPALPVAVMVRFDDYTGPTVHDGTVPITPVRRSWTFLWSMFTPSTTTQASMGSDDPQISRTHTRQSGH